MLYQGSCHCGAVQIEVEAPEIITCEDCNCSICAKSGFLHLIVPRYERAGAPDTGLAPGTRQADVPLSWRCPD